MWVRKGMTTADGTSLPSRRATLIDPSSFSTHDVAHGLPFIATLQPPYRYTKLNNRFQAREEPAAPAAYFVKTIIDAIALGPATEKELRSAVIDVCKRDGIRATTRGTVAGLNIEVSSVCGVLALLGIIEPANDTAASALEAVGTLEADSWSASSSSSSSSSSVQKVRPPRSGGRKVGHRFSSHASTDSLQHTPRSPRDDAHAEGEGEIDEGVLLGGEDTGVVELLATRWGDLRQSYLDDEGARTK